LAEQFFDAQEKGVRVIAEGAKADDADAGIEKGPLVIFVDVVTYIVDSSQNQGACQGLIGVVVFVVEAIFVMANHGLGA